MSAEEQKVEATSQPNDAVERIIKYCIKSMYLEKKDLQEFDEQKGEETLFQKVNEELLQKDLQKEVDDLIKKKIKCWEDFKKEQYENDAVDLKTQVKLFNDSVHKSIELNALEVAVIDTPEFSRLRGIKQLGGVSYVYQGAMHSRFEHCIGVCHLAGRFIDRLRIKLEKYKNRQTDEMAIISLEEEQCIRLAALCHDLGHGPFSHMFEGLRKKIVKEELQINEVISHEQISILLFKHLLVNNMKVLARFEKFGLTCKHVWMIEFMIDPKPTTKRHFLYEIVANKDSGMDVDKWDYYARDCHYLGVTNEFDYGRLMELSNIVKKGEGQNVEYHIGFRRKEKDNIYRMFRTRTVLYQKAYVHQVGDAVEMMISDALFKIRNEKILFIGERAMNLKEIVEQFVPNSSRKALFNIDAFVALKDSLLDIIENQNTKETENQNTKVTEDQNTKETEDQNTKETEDQSTKETEDQNTKETEDQNTKETEYQNTKETEDQNTKESPIREAKDILMRLKKRELYWCCHEIVIPNAEMMEIQTYEEKIKELRGECYPADEVLGKEEVSQTCKFEIQAPKNAYSSEKGDPAKKRYFYEEAPKEETISGDKTRYYYEQAPKIQEEGSDPARMIYFYEQEKYLPSVCENVTVSLLHTPKTFTEYRVRLYCKECKNKKNSTEDAKTRYEKFLKEQLSKEL